jgi:hypothetical protein
VTLAEYLEGVQAAETAADLEVAIRAPFKHAYHGPTWSRIQAATTAQGLAICDAHPDGRFVPRFGKHRMLMVCGEAFKVGRGQNSTGVRYCWHYATEFAREVLLRNGLTQTAARDVLGQWSDYPHRCLSTIEKWRAGKLQDPPLDRLILWHTSSGPVRVNRREEEKHRAWRPCGCGGRRWDWGSGWNGWCSFITWYCDRCTRVYGEYLSDGRLMQIRQRKAA